MTTIQKYWDKKPLTIILCIAALFRLIAVFFSKGYGMHDDHFLVIEAAQSWVDAADYNNWIPSDANKMLKPSGHSLLYPGLHYLLFRFLQFLGIHDPQAKMYFVRLFHAAWSMIIVYLGFKIALRKGNIKAAKMTGILLAILFFMPMMSVRNLVEFVCIPPLLFSTWIVIKNEEIKKNNSLLLAGVMLSIALSIRFQTALFIGGFGLTLIIQKKWKEIIWTGIGFLTGLIIIQATTDMIIWKKPFMELQEYISYNLQFSHDYPNLPWYSYLLLISGILVPPISLFLIFGFVKNWRKNLFLFLPSFIFLLFHSLFQNKQERFILPILPFIIILGSIGWIDYMSKSNFWKTHARLYRSGWIIFFSLNTIPLLFISVAYSHKNRVESMVYLSGKKDLNNILIEESNRDNYTLPPRFYLKQWKSDYFITSVYTVDSLAERIKESPPELIPNYVVFNQPENLPSRIQNLKKIFPRLVYETTIEPGFIDKVMFHLNKHNSNFTSYIYKVEK